MEVHVHLKNTFPVGIGNRWIKFFDNLWFASHSSLWMHSAVLPWKNRTLVGHEPLMCSKMCFTKTEYVQVQSWWYSQSHFRMLFQSLKLKARTSLVTEAWQKRCLSFELWAFENVTPRGIRCTIFWSLPYSNSTGVYITLKYIRPTTGTVAWREADAATFLP